MFDSSADARLHLQKDFTPAQIETVVTALVPALTFRPIERGAIEIGGTRIGGTPDLPPGLAWPHRPMPANVEEFAKRGNAEAAAEIRAPTPWRPKAELPTRRSTRMRRALSRSCRSAISIPITR